MNKTILCMTLSVSSCAMAGSTAPGTDVRISNSRLVAICVDGAPVSAGERRWSVAAPVSMTFTMRNEPRTGRPGAEAGYAAIAFTPEAGHVYEIEVRSDPLMYSSRVWPKGEWTPVVRDRTTNRIVSGDPKWLDAPGCDGR
jgi:hypothetical protein